MGAAVLRHKRAMAQLKGHGMPESIHNKIMQEASNDIVKEALIRNVTADMNRAARDILTEQEEKDKQEKQFDSDLEDDLDLDDDPELRALERRRLEEMKKQHATKQANRIKGH